LYSPWSRYEANRSTGVDASANASRIANGSAHARTPADPDHCRPRSHQLVAGVHPVLPHERTGAPCAPTVAFEEGSREQSLLNFRASHTPTSHRAGGAGPRGNIHRAAAITATPQVKSPVRLFTAVLQGQHDEWQDDGVTSASSRWRACSTG
jgi:hypothetical protein